MADSITMNPHKMMGAPVTCSFLLGRDMRVFWRANTLPAGYLFHSDEAEADGLESEDHYDLGDLTLQCGRRGDALKLALGWIYYGREGYGAQIDNAFEVAAYFASIVEAHPQLQIIGPGSCLQVCFYVHLPSTVLANGINNGNQAATTTRCTRLVAKALVQRGFMVDYASGSQGEFFRAVVHLATTKKTVEMLVEAVVESASQLE